MIRRSWSRRSAPASSRAAALNDPNLDSKSNFGYTVKRLKSGNLPGQQQLHLPEDVGVNEVSTERLPAGRPYNWQIKSNSWAGGGLTSSLHDAAPIKCTATFSGKANIKAINRVTGRRVLARRQLPVPGRRRRLPRAGSSPGAGPDGYAIRVWDPTTGTYYQLGSPRTWNPAQLWKPAPIRASARGSRSRRRKQPGPHLSGD
jgi:hypothetical protein